MRAIIVDDEKHSRDALQTMLAKYCPNVIVQALCCNGEEALEAIRQLTPEIVFLDVEMPVLDGFQVLEACQQPQFAVIFVTAYDQYALQAIHYSALDYLLKPIDAKELQIAVEKTGNLPVDETAKMIGSLLSFLMQDDRKALPTAHGLKVITARNIIYCKAIGNQTRIFLQPPENQVTIKARMHDLLSWLADRGFMQVHTDFLINLSLMEKYIKGDGGAIVMCNGDNIPLSRDRKQDFLLRVEHL